MVDCRVASESSNLREVAAISSTARSNACWLAFDGLWKPLILRTNWSAAAWYSSAVGACSGRRRTLMLRHIVEHCEEESLMLFSVADWTLCIQKKIANSPI